MRALRYHDQGKPTDVLRLDDLPTPEPGPGEVRLRLTHRSLNPADLHAILGAYGKQPNLPAVAGHEGMGTVEAVGEGVDRLAVGQRVVPMGLDGTWAEQAVIEAPSCLPISDDLDDEAAAQLFVNPLTAHLLLDTLGLPEGAWLVQTAGTSQVGRLVVQLAQWRGIRTLSLVRRESARDELVALGADAVAVVDGEADARALRRIVREHTGPEGVDGALDAVAGRLGGALAGCLVPHATMLVYGGLSGEPLALPAGTLIFGRATVRGFWRTGWFDEHGVGAARPHLEHLARLVAEGALRLPIEARYDLADFREAVAHSRREGTRGKVILTG